MFRTLNNVAVIAASSVLQAAVVFAKGVILARILGVHQFGLAVIIIAITGALDMFADAGIDRYIVQSRFGYRPDVINTSHAYRVAGSTIVGILIGALSFPLSIVFKAPELFLPIAATGGIVILRGFVNLGYKLQQRDHRFEQETIIDSTRTIVDLAVTTAAAYYMHSFLAVLVGFYANAITHVILSHIVTRNNYDFRPRRALVKLVGRFSVPIYINATMLFAAMQGDRLVVAAMFNKREVALYAVACTLGQGVTTLIGKVTERILLPVLRPGGKFQSDSKRVVSLLGLLFVIGSFMFELSVCSVGPWATRIIYGPAYVRITGIIFAASIFQMIQLQQAWLNSVIMANGLTIYFPRITLMRSIAFPAAILFGIMGFSIIAIPIAFALGASFSLAMSYYSARKLDLIDRRLPFLSFFVIGISLLAVIVLSARHLL